MTRAAVLATARRCLTCGQAAHICPAAQSALARVCMKGSNDDLYCGLLFECHVVEVTYSYWLVCVDSDCTCAGPRPCCFPTKFSPSCKCSTQGLVMCEV